ncbi:MAG TPA: amidase [Gemmatimonadales bacterium]|nr:amidase [Gemmatimonadales bacterium]
MPELSRRGFLGLAALGAAALADRGRPTGGGVGRQRPTVPSGSFELEEVTVAELRDGLRSGRWTSHDLVTAYLERVAALDREGPALHHVLETNPDALAIARELDRERRAGRERGPLHGIPVLLKDNIDTADRMATTAGSLALEGSRAPRDAFLVERLRAAGAIILAKTNLSEWANFRSTRSSSGWSSRGGQGRNPYALDRNPCGSSSGSAAAVAANYAPLAVGTETDGSITCPAAANGIVGLKPTIGLVSRSGIIPIAHSQDTAGPMARTVTDAAILLGVLAGADPRDPATRAAAPQGITDYTRSLQPGGLEGIRLGVARKRFFGYHDGTDRLIEAAIEVLRGLGATVIDPADIPHAGEYDDAEFEVLLYEFKADLETYLRSRGPDVPVRTLADIIEFNQRNAARVMPYFGQEIMLQAVAKGPLTAPAYRRARATCRRLARRLGMDAGLARHRLDAFLAPTGNPAWPTDLVNGDHFTGSVTTPAAVAGYPHITVPAGFVFGLPVGISFFGRAWSEPLLLRIAYAYEQATRHRRRPEFLPTIPFDA